MKNNLKDTARVVIVVGHCGAGDHLEAYNRRANNAWEGCWRNCLGDWQYDEGLIFTDDEVLEVVEFEKAHGNRVFFDDENGQTVSIQ